LIAKEHQKIDQRRVDVLSDHDQKLPTKEKSLSVCHITFLSGYICSGTLRMYVLTRCHVTDINHVLTPCHVTAINYVDRGVAARTPLQLPRILRFLFLLYFCSTSVL